MTTLLFAQYPFSTSYKIYISIAIANLRNLPQHINSNWYKLNFTQTNTFVFLNKEKKSEAKLNKFNHAIQRKYAIQLAQS